MTSPVNLRNDSESWADLRGKEVPEMQSLRRDRGAAPCGEPAGPLGAAGAGCRGASRVGPYGRQACATQEGLGGVHEPRMCGGRWEGALGWPERSRAWPVALSSSVCPRRPSPAPAPRACGSPLVHVCALPTGDGAARGGRRRGQAGCRQVTPRFTRGAGRRHAPAVTGTRFLPTTDLLHSLPRWPL